MNALNWTYEEVQDKNSTNTNKSKNIFADTINKFKNKILDIISPKKTKEINLHKEINTFQDTKNTIKKAENKNTIQFINKNASESLLSKLNINNAEISNLKNKLTKEKELLAHFEKIKWYIPSWAENEIITLQRNIENIENKLIDLEVENLKIDSRLNPLRKLESEWKTNIFNPDNKINKAYKVNMELSIAENIERLKWKLELEKKLLHYFKTEVTDNEDDIKMIKNNITIIEDNLITLEKARLRKENKVLPFTKQLFWWENNIFNPDNKKEPTKKLNPEEKLDESINKLEYSLKLEKKLLTFLETEKDDEIADIIRVKINIKNIEDNLISLKLKKIRLSWKKA